MRIFSSIGFKLIVASLLVGGAMAAGLVWVLLTYQRNLLEQIYVSQAITLAHSFDAAFTRDDLGDVNKLQNKIYKFMYVSSEVKDIDLNLKQKDGLVVAASSDVSRIGSVVQVGKSEISRTKDKTGQEVLVIISPINISGEEVGNYEITFSTDLARKANRDLLRSLLIAVGGFGACSVIVYWLVFRFTMLDSINKLVKGAEELGKGNLQLKIAVSSHDELGKLAVTFNEMAIKLQKQYADLEQKVSERTQELELNQQFLKETQSIANFGSYELDFKTGIWKSSEVLDRIFGIDKQFVRSVDGWLALVHPDDRQLMQDYFKDHVAGGEHHFDKEYRIVRINDKKEVWVHGLGNVTLGKDNKPVVMQGTIQDVTEKKRGELTLAKENDLIKQYIDSAGVIIVAINANKQVTLINKMGAKLIGLPEQAIVGKDWFANFVPVAIRDEIAKQFSLLITGKIEGLEYYENPILNAKGEERLIAWHNSFLKDASGKIISSISSGEDITEKKEQEQTLKKMNDLMVDRELKMVELKKQLAELKK